jgi:ribosomal protein S18
MSSQDTVTKNNPLRFATVNNKTMRVARPSNTVTVKNPLRSNTYNFQRRDTLSLAKTFENIRNKSIKELEKLKKDDPKRVARVIRENKELKEAQNLRNKYYGKSAAISGSVTVKNKRTWFERMFKRNPKLYKKSSNVMTKRKRNRNAYIKDRNMMSKFIVDSRRIVDLDTTGTDGHVRDVMARIEYANDAGKRYLQKYNNLELA